MAGERPAEVILQDLLASARSARSATAYLPVPGGDFIQPDSQASLFTFAAGEGTTVHAVWSAEVTAAQPSHSLIRLGTKGAGELVYTGLVPEVRAGDLVRAGQRLGTVDQDQVLTLRHSAQANVDHGLNLFGGTDPVERADAVWRPTIGFDLAHLVNRVQSGDTAAEASAKQDAGEQDDPATGSEPITDPPAPAHETVPPAPPLDAAPPSGPDLDAADPPEFDDDTPDEDPDDDLGDFVIRG